jgi:NADH dehydrogenase
MTIPPAGQTARRPRPHVLIVGGGFGGLWAARALRDAPVRVTLVDRQNHHLFQPLLYQVATAALSPGDIAVPIREILRQQRNVRVLLGEAERVDLAARCVVFKGPPTSQGGTFTIGYDYLVLATGARHGYFAHPEWEWLAPGLKTIEDALEIRRRILLAYEEAEREPDPARRAALLTFVIVGAGPTGVELAGALAEIARMTLHRQFRAIDPRQSRVLLLEGGPRVLPTYPEDLSAKAEEQLRDLGVEVRTGTLVTEVTPDGVRASGQWVPSRTVLWAAGVVASPLAKSLDVPLDRAGRVVVEPDLSVPGDRNAFVIGDLASFMHPSGIGEPVRFPPSPALRALRTEAPPPVLAPLGEPVRFPNPLRSGAAPPIPPSEKPVPGVAPAAMQGGTFVARAIAADLAGRPRGRFRYWDKGSLATIGRQAGVADFGRLKLSGLPAWLAWLFIHLFFLIGFQNRLLVFLQWMWSYLTFQRGARLITGSFSPAVPHRQDPA